MLVMNQYCNITHTAPVVRRGMVVVVGHKVDEQQVGKWRKVVVKVQRKKLNKHGNPVSTRIKSRSINHFRNKAEKKLVKRINTKGTARVNREDQDQVDAANKMITEGVAVVVKECKRTTVIGKA